MNPAPTSSRPSPFAGGPCRSYEEYHPVRIHRLAWKVSLAWLWITVGIVGIFGCGARQTPGSVWRRQQLLSPPSSEELQSVLDGEGIVVEKAGPQAIIVRVNGTIRLETPLSIAVVVVDNTLSLTCAGNAAWMRPLDGKEVSVRGMLFSTLRYSRAPFESPYSGRTDAPQLILEECRRIR